VAGSWTLEDGGDGYFGLSSTSGVLSEDVVAHEGGDAAVMSGR
jgi:hypothetical protein